MNVPFGFLLFAFCLHFSVHRSIFSIRVRIKEDKEGQKGRTFVEQWLTRKDELKQRRGRVPQTMDERRNSKAVRAD